MGDVRSFHPSSEDLAQLHDAATSDAVRSRLLAHIADCSECAEAVKVSLALQPETQAFSESLAQSQKSGDDVQHQARPRRFQQWAIAASILVAAGIGFWIMPSSEPGPVVLRGGSAEVSPKPGSQLVAIPSTFTWSNPNPGQFILLDSMANPVFEATAEEGQIRVDGELAHVLSAGGQFLWRVDIDGRTLGPFPIEIVAD